MKVFDLIKNCSEQMTIVILSDSTNEILYAGSMQKLFWFQKHEDLRKAKIKNYYISKISVKIWI